MKIPRTLQMLIEAHAAARRLAQAEQYLQNLSLTEEYLKTLMKTVSTWSTPIAIDVHLQDGRTITIRQDSIESQTRMTFKDKFTQERQR